MKKQINHPNSENKILVQGSTFVGPIPPPDILASYEQLQAGFAERIIKMAEQQGTHRREMESLSLCSQIKHIESRDFEAKLGQIFAFAISLVTITGGLFAGIKGAEITGSIIGSGGLVAIVATFIYGRRSEKKSNN